MLLIRLLFSASLGLAISLTSGTAHADDELSMVAASATQARVDAAVQTSSTTVGLPEITSLETPELPSALTHISTAVPAPDNTSTPAANNSSIPAPIGSIETIVDNPPAPLSAIIQDPVETNETAAPSSTGQLLTTASIPEQEATSRVFQRLDLLEFSTTLARIPGSEAIDSGAVTPSSSIALELGQADEIGPDLWDRLRHGFGLHDMNSKLVDKYERWYAHRPEYVASVIDRARRYLYYILTEVERRGMPSEIALLPIIESAFNPSANSSSRASGIWQFIPSTGKNFGMEQNWWYDGRRDIISATNGALDYLQQLYGMFGDWELALAAYNCGEGTIQRAVTRNRRRGRPTGYTSLKMPRETRNYVPKLLAVKNIIASPESFGLDLPSIPNEPYFGAVSTTKHIDVKLAAELADVSMDEFMALNPGHNRPVILQGTGDLILLPLDKIETFRTNLENYDKPLVSWQAYQPKRGERLDRLAPRFGLSVENLKSINGLRGRSNISTGQTLLVPVNGEIGETEFEAFNMHLAPPQEPSRRTIRHTVRSGESFYSIAHRYHISIASLQKANRRIKHLRPGQKLVIKKVAWRNRTSRSGNPDTIHHTVRSGESFYSIAHRYHVSIASLQKANRRIKHLKPGQKLVIRETAARNVQIADSRH